MCYVIVLLTSVLGSLVKGQKHVFSISWTCCNSPTLEIKNEKTLITRQHQLGNVNFRNCI